MNYLWPYNENHNFNVGDSVVTDYYPNEASVVRTITEIVRDEAFVSGFRIVLDPGDGVAHLHENDSRKSLGFDGIDARWLYPAEDLPLLLLMAD